MLSLHHPLIYGRLLFSFRHGHEANGGKASQPRVGAVSRVRWSPPVWLRMTTRRFSRRPAGPRSIGDAQLRHL